MKKKIKEIKKEKVVLTIISQKVMRYENESLKMIYVYYVTINAKCSNMFKYKVDCRKRKYNTVKGFNFAVLKVRGFHNSDLSRWF